MKILHRTSLFALAAGAFLLAVTGCNPNRNNPNLNAEPSETTPSAPVTPQQAPGTASKNQSNPNATQSVQSNAATGYGQNVNPHASQPGTLGRHLSNPGNQSIPSSNTMGNYGLAGKSPGFGSNTGSILGAGDEAITGNTKPGTAIAPRGSAPNPRSSQSPPNSQGPQQ